MARTNTRQKREFREQMKALWRAENRPCARDGQPIDWDAPANTRDAFELGHILPVKTHPHLELDPNNVQPEHHRCNRHAGASTSTAASTGITSEVW